MRISYQYASPGAHALSALALAVGLLGGVATSQAAVDDTTVQEAREALRVRDRARLLAARDALIAGHHPLAPWADYWYFQARLIDASPSLVDEFLARWPDSYVADRARNDWLLELGRRRDWRTFLRIQPSFRMNDDREVSCLGVLARFQTQAPMEGPGDWREQARQAWWGQKDADFGCDAMAQALLAARVLEPDDVWRKLRLAIEADKPRAVQQSARLLGDTVSQAVNRVMMQPLAILVPSGKAAASLVAAGDERKHTPGASMSASPKVGKHKDKDKDKGKASRRKGKAAKPDPTPVPLAVPTEALSPLNLLAFIRWTGMDPQASAQAMGDSAQRGRWRWNAEESAWAWAQLGRSSAWRLMPEAPGHFERALADRALAAGTGEMRLSGSRVAASWSAETLAWMARTGLRAASAGQTERWHLVEQAVDAMAPDQQQDATWLYWKAKALQGRAKSGASSPVVADGLRQQARDLLARAAHPLTFYGQLAAEELHGGPVRAPARPAPLTDNELADARAIPGIDRALRMLDLGWRTEALKEWNFTLSYAKAGGLSDRELMAVAEEACHRELWDRCINSSDRTRHEFNLEQRYPMPFKQDVLKAANEVGLDPAYMYGLIRQESRFITVAKSVVGASGLMQVMPGTAAWTARKLSIEYHPGLLMDRMTNLRLGAGYLKLVLDDFQGAQGLAAAAYNAGPSRPRRWREGPRIDAAAWAENIPFNETRDYVKKVLANATVYGHLINGKSLSVRNRLGATVGPRAPNAPPSEDDLP